MGNSKHNRLLSLLPNSFTYGSDTSGWELGNGERGQTPWEGELISQRLGMLYLQKGSRGVFWGSALNCFTYFTIETPVWSWPRYLLLLQQTPSEADQQFTSTLTTAWFDELFLGRKLYPIQNETPDHLNLMQGREGSLRATFSPDRPDNAVSSWICKIALWPKNQSSRILTSQLTTNKLFFTLTWSSLLTRSTSVLLLLQGLEKLPTERPEYF